MKKQLISVIALFAKTALAKKEEVKPSTGIVKLGDRKVGYDELDALLEGMEEGEEITADYFEIEEGESVRAVVLGKRKFQAKAQEGKEAKVLDAIKMYANGKVVIAAQTMLVSNLMDAAIKAEEKGINTPVQIEFLGKEKAAVGTYDKFRITYLS